MRRDIAALLSVAAAAIVATSCAQPATSSDPVNPSPTVETASRFVAGVHRTVLPNGLTVLTREDPGSGVVAINTWVKAGYFHESDEVAGMAHLFEHMFFKGSKAYPGAEAIGRAITGAGGALNAGTIYDSTNYFTVMPKASFVRGIEVQADAIAHPTFDPAELKKEAEVVIEESNRKLDNPPAVALERMFATSYTQHRFKRWRIGSNEVLRSIQRDNLVAFFDTLYRPENIIVTVAGDVSPAEALAAVTKSYGSIPRGTPKKERGPKEPPQNAFRFGQSQADVKEGYAVFGWHTIAENHEDEQTLEVLATILGRGRSSRLNRAVVGPKGASTVTASHMTFEDVGVFYVSASLPEANRADVESKILAEVERMKRHGPTDYELAQAKNMREAALMGEIDNALDQAQLLSSSESRGSYRDVVKRAAQTVSLTNAQVQAAARRYLTLDQLTLYQYQPKGAAVSTREAALERLRKAEGLAADAPAQIALPDVSNSVRAAATATPLQTFKLANGATLAVQQRPGTGTASTGIYFRGGRIRESAANAGITRLTQAVMRRGTASRSGDAIDREINFFGASVGTQTQEDGFGFTFSTAQRFYEPALRIAADVIRNPSLPEAEIARERGLQLAASRRTLDSATERPMQLFRAAMYAGHPYGLPELGTEQSLAAIDRAAIVSWWQSMISADRALVVVVGDVSADDVRRVMEEQLGKLPSVMQAMVMPPAPKIPTAPVETTEQRDRKQTAMVIGFPSVPPADPQWPAFRLMQAVTTGLSGTFFAELRGRQSLAYTVSAAPVSFASYGAFRGYLAGDASKEAVARAALLAEMRKLQGPGVTEEDLARAKAYYAGTTRMSLQTNGARSDDYGRNFVLGVPLDQTERTLAVAPKLTVEDLRAAAKRYLSGENYVYAAVRGK